MRETEVETKKARIREQGAGDRTSGKKRAEINRVTKTGQRCTKRAAEPETDENRESKGSTEQLNKTHRELQRIKSGGKGKEREEGRRGEEGSKGEMDR